MTIRECYKAMDANYDEVLERLRSERLIIKCVLKFLDDASFDTLCRSMETGEWEQAFRASHTLKGVSQNLGFVELGVSSHDLTEALRAGNTAQAAALLGRVKADYARAAGAVRDFREAQEL